MGLNPDFWRPRLGVAEALDGAVEWQRGHAAGDDLRALTLAQIERYERFVGRP